MNPPRVVAHVLLGFSVMGCARFFWDLKPQAQGAIAGSIALLLLVSGLVRRGSAVVSGVVMGTAMLGAVVGASVYLAMMAAPARAEDGHAVMPIGQVLCGSIGGVVLGSVVTVLYSRTVRVSELEVVYARVLVLCLLLVMALDRFC